MRPLKKEVIEIDVEPDVDGLRQMHGRLERREIAGEDVLRAKVREFMLDELYGVYYNALAESGEANRTSWQNLDGDNAGFDEDFMNNNDDPQYKFFLANLREIGNSYMIEHNVGDSGPTSIVYEVEDGLYDSHEVRGIKRKKKGVERNAKTQKAFSASKRLRTESGRECCILREKVTQGLHSSSTAPKVRNRGSQQSKGDVVQQGWKTSMDKRNVGLKAEKFVSCQRKSSEGRQPSPEVVSCQRNSNSGRQPSPKVPNFEACQRKSSADRQPSPEVASCRRNSNSGRQPSPKVPNFEAHKSKTEKNHGMEDESYKRYLSWLLAAEGNSQLNTEKGLIVQCETDTSSSSDSDVLEMSDHPFSDGEDTPFVSSKSYYVFDGEERKSGPRGTCNSWFRKELMDVLRKPYDEKEFCKLSCDVSIRKQITREKQLRNGRVITYLTDYLGSSYLDMYPDFKKQYRSCGTDRCRALNLLRGFFFYLKNMVHQGVFKPWLDAECSKTVALGQAILLSASANRRLQIAR